MTQKLHITDLETALLAATDLAKRQCARIEELEAIIVKIRPDDTSTRRARMLRSAVKMRER